MTFLAPTAALIVAGITIPSLLALYFLKRRRRLIPVASTLLWRKAIEDMQVNAPFQRLRRNLLLLLQLLILAGLLFALARPATQQTAAMGRRTVIVIDHSGSMNATDISPTRLEAAKSQAIALIDDVDTAMVISIAQQARVVQPFTTDRSLLRSGVRSIMATDQQGRVEPALRLIEPFAAEGEGASMLVYVISDGKLSDERTVALRGAELKYIQVGDGAAGNVAITAVSARRDFDNPQQIAVFARVGNFTDKVVDTTVTLDRDGAMWDVRRVSVPPGESASVQFAVEAAGGVFLEAAHDVTDALKADNRVALNVAPPREVTVALVTEGNAFLQRALKAAGAAKVIAIAPSEYEKDGAPAEADVYVFDRWGPTEMPLRDSLYFAASPPIEGLELAKIEEGEGGHLVLDWRRDHALLRAAALDDLLLADTRRLVLPDGARTLVTADVGPIMAVVEREGVRHVVAGFDVLKTTWPMQVSFAVFMVNTLDWMAVGSSSPTAGGSYRPGEAAVIDAPSEGGEVVYYGPSNLEAQVRAGRAVLPVFKRAGVYYAKGKIGPPFDRLAVNMTNAGESDIRAAAQLAVGTETIDAIKADAAQVRREVWRWFIGAALVVLMVEWVVYARRMHL